MTGATVLPFGREHSFPPAQVLDLAIAVAIGRDLARTEAELLERIEDWFLRPATRSEVAGSIARLLDKNWLRRSGRGEFTFCLTAAGIAATTTLSGGMIRMIDCGRGLFKTAFLLQMLELGKGQCP
ncbi:MULTISPECIES: hypothetical protein [unclassified Sphingomonas]|uniref:hypothetical protein n=1 Tax=Novosphingobium rhizosphaerae TaxID=1551649 RepID=UPI0015CA2625